MPRASLVAVVFAFGCGGGSAPLLHATVAPVAVLPDAPSDAVRLGFGQAEPPFVVDNHGHVILGVRPEQRATLGFHGSALDVATLMDWRYPASPSQICALLEDRTIECATPYYGKETRRWGPFPRVCGRPGKGAIPNATAQGRVASVDSGATRIVV